MNRIRVIVLHTVASLLLVLSGSAHLRAVLVQAADAGGAASVRMGAAAADAGCDLLTVRAAAGRRLTEPCGRRRERGAGGLPLLALSVPLYAVAALPSVRARSWLRSVAFPVPDKFKTFVSFLQSLL